MKTTIVLAMAGATLLSSCARSSSTSSTATETAAPMAVTTTAPADAVPIRIVTSEGTIDVVLDKRRTPKTTANFLRYVTAGFYNGGTFFRAVPGFVIQGGNKPRERATDPKIVLEPPIKTGLRNLDGAISMARTTEPNSATSEFFICDGDQSALDGSMSEPGYAAFGHVVAGMDVVRKIAEEPANNQMLLKPVKIVKIVRLPAGSRT
jgi:peptidyl-prolyl cis-trans isomerase A (cyclophilin A)